MSVVCCQTAHLLFLVSPADVPVPPSFTSDSCFLRCGPTCLGVGSVPESPCVGCERPTEPRGGVCSANERIVRTFQFRRDSNQCDDWSCRVNSTRVVGGHGGSVDVRFASSSSEVSFVGDVVPRKSNVVGPGVIRVLGSGPLKVEHPATLRNVRLVGNVGDGCGVEVQLPERKIKEATAISDVSVSGVAGWSGCSVLVTPARGARVLRGRGTLKIDVAPRFVTGGFDVVLRSVDGSVYVNGDDSPSVLLYEHVGGETKVFASGPVTNLTSFLGLFSPAYLVEYFHNGIRYRGVPVPRFVDKNVGWSVLVAVVLVLGAVMLHNPAAANHK